MNSAHEQAGESRKPIDQQAHSKACWPATPRDWLAAHSCVRFGRLDRFSAIRHSRDRLVRFMARDRSFVQFHTDSGFHILLPASYRSMMIMALGGVLFHRTLVEVASKAVRPGDVVIDGGSNVGFFAMLAARKLKGNGRVVAFEPDPDTFALLARNITLNGLGNTLKAEQLALADKDGVLDFVPNFEEPMLSSAVSRGTSTAASIRVRSTSLDSYLRISGLGRADIIKMDLEGAEPMALAGARAALSTARMLIFEVNEPQLKQLGVAPVALVEETARAGEFDTVYFIDERSETIHEWTAHDFDEALNAYKFINVVCSRSNSMPAAELTSPRTDFSSACHEASPR